MPLGLVNGAPLGPSVERIPTVTPAASATTARSSAQTKSRRCRIRRRASPISGSSRGSLGTCSAIAPSSLPPPQAGKKPSFKGSFRNTGPGEWPLARPPLVAGLAEDVGDLRQCDGVAELDGHALLGAAPFDPRHGTLAQGTLRLASIRVR